uniref:Cytochrome c oxidase assembly factor 3 n=2 Tax=Equus TaxID=9789 RepID=A0A9L0TGJ7_HORSE
AAQVCPFSEAFLGTRTAHWIHKPSRLASLQNLLPHPGFLVPFCVLVLALRLRKTQVPPRPRALHRLFPPQRPRTPQPIRKHGCYPSPPPFLSAESRALFVKETRTATPSVPCGGQGLLFPASLASSDCEGRSGNMAASGSGDPVDAKSGEAPPAQRIDPTREKLTPAQLQFMRQVQLAQWQKTLPQRRTRNIVTGLGIGALVLAIYGYTFYSVSQERFLDELEDEVKAARARALERASGP